jgi:hypothetical protein
MQLHDHLKRVFPKPRLPQKRYMVLLCALIYVGLRIYTTQTTTTQDDSLPNDFSAMAQIGLSADNESEPNVDSDSSNPNDSPVIIEAGNYEYGEGDY